MVNLNDGARRGRYVEYPVGSAHTEHRARAGRRTNRPSTSSAHADKTGERITLGTVEHRLTELAGHPPGHCPLCTVAFVECCILDRAVEYLGHAIVCGILRPP